MLDYIKKNRTISVILAVLGTILLGIFCNALWEFIFRGFLIWVSKTIIDLFSSWFASFNGHVYQDIAKGFHEYHSLKLRLLLEGIFCGFSFFSVLLLMFHKKIFELLGLSGGRDLSAIFINKKIYYAIILFFIFLISSGILDITVEAYQNIAIARFEQYLTICSPYIVQKDISGYRSEFAQIKDKKDYQNIIYKLQNIISTNGLVLPKY